MSTSYGSSNSASPRRKSTSIPFAPAFSRATAICSSQPVQVIPSTFSRYFSINSSFVPIEILLLRPGDSLRQQSHFRVFNFHVIRKLKYSFSTAKIYFNRFCTHVFKSDSYMLFTTRTCHSLHVHSIFFMVKYPPFIRRGDPSLKPPS